jgi:SAM-dependent methyltransferase
MIYTDYLKTRSLKGFLYRLFFAYPLILCRLKPPILDYGCGLGDFLVFSSYFVSVFGADIDLSLSESRFDSRRLFLAHDKDLIPRPKFLFGSILIDNVLEHISDPSATLKIIKQYLAPQGILLIGLPGVKGFKRDPDHKHYYTSEELTSLLEPDFILRNHFALPVKSNTLSNHLSFYVNYYLFIFNP